MLSTDEIRNQVTQLHPPKEVQEIRVDFGADSDDDPAVWISLYVDESISDATIAELTRFKHTVRETMLRGEPGPWPYVIVRSR
jgi:hypothetical protein